MKRGWQPALLVLLLGALALVLVLPKSSKNSTAPIQRDGSFPLPDGTYPVWSRVMPNGKLALAVEDIPSGAQYNLYVFDTITNSYTGYNFSTTGAHGVSVYSNSDMVANASSTMLACSYIGAAGPAPDLTIGNMATGEIEFGHEADYLFPKIRLASGLCSGINIAIGVDAYEARVFFYSFDNPGLLGTIFLPESYAIPRAWRGLETDYHNILSSWPYFHFSSSTSTLFLPLPHLGLIYWCQPDLSGGFSYQDGTISCGVDPTFIAAPPSGSPLYILDDRANKVFVLDPGTRSITKSIDYEAGNIALRLIEHQGYIYITTRDRSTNPRVGGLIKIDPVTEQQWSVEFNGWSPSDLDAYQGRIYMIKKTGPPSNTTPTLVEYDAATLTLLSETFICANGWQMDIIAQTGKGVIRDAEARALFVVDLRSLGKN